MATARLRYSTTLVLASALLSGLAVSLNSEGVRVRCPRSGERVDGSMNTGREILGPSELPGGACSRKRLERFAALDGTLGRRIPSGALQLRLRGGAGGNESAGESRFNGTVPNGRFLGRDSVLENLNAGLEKGVQRGVDMQYVDKTEQVGEKGGDEDIMFKVIPDEREFFIDSLLARIHLFIVMIRWTGLAPWEFVFPFPGIFTSTFLVFPTMFLLHSLRIDPKNTILR